MLTGSRVYAGKTVSDTLAGVLAREPEWDNLPKSLPRSIRNLLERCLEKESRDRLQAIGEARLAIQRYLDDPEQEETAAAKVAGEGAATRKSLLPWAVAALTAIVAIVLGVLFSRELGREDAVIRAKIAPPEGTVFHLTTIHPGPAVISPDGTRVAFSARDEEDVVRLYVRALGEAAPSLLSGTEGAQYPFWSPDSRFLGFFTQVDATLKKVEVSGAPPITLCPAPDGKGGSWSEKGVIVFAPGSGTPLHRVSAKGGESVPISDFDSERGDDSHRHPRFLPGGEHFFFVARVGGGTVANAIVLRSIEGGDDRVVLQSPAPVQFASGHLLFVRDRVLMAQPFDLDSRELLDEPFPIIQDIFFDTGSSIGVFSASQNGVLTYQTGSGYRIDSSGNTVGQLGDAAAYQTVNFSPDGTMAAVGIADMAGGGWDIWIYDIERDLRTRFTFHEDTESFPVWSPDGGEIIFASDREGTFDLYRKPLGGTGQAELLFSSESNIFPTSWSPDGQHVLFFEGTSERAYELWVLPLSGEPEPRLLRSTPYDEGAAVFSPDGRWVAFWSVESGAAEIYVMPFPGPGKIQQVTPDQGTWSAWPSGGTELIYALPTGAIEGIEIDYSGDEIRVGASREIAMSPVPEISGWSFSPTPDGQQLLVISGGELEYNDTLELFVNWPATLAER
jgi:Tol biopolymer transport system component